jgi:hypothetical protein
MSADLLLARAAEADRRADAIFVAMAAARRKEPADYLGQRPHIPTGWGARASEASDLRREAERLRFEAAPVRTSQTGASVALASPPSSGRLATPQTAAARKPESKTDPVDDLVAQIVSSAKAAGR